MDGPQDGTRKAHTKAMHVKKREGNISFRRITDTRSQADYCTGATVSKNVTTV